MRNRVLMMALATAGMTVGYATPAAAQATRTWVSGVGDDVNPCSRTAPCKTFAGAISKTAAGGEINCLDPGGYGAVTITKSMTISCPYTEGGALAGGNGIVVNDGATATPNTAVVFLRGLDIFGVNPPSNGVRFVAGAALHIEDSTIRRFNAANSFGVSFQPAGTASLYITRTTIADNGSGASGGGVLVQPTGTGNAEVVIDDADINNNANTAVRVDSTGNTGTGGISVVVRNTNMNGNGAGGLAAVNAAGTNTVAVMVTDSTIAHNNGPGIIGNGSGATVRVGNTTVTGNNSGVTAAGSSQVLTYGNNRVVGNPTVGIPNNGAFVGGIQAQQ